MRWHELSAAATALARIASEEPHRPVIVRPADECDELPVRILGGGSLAHPGEGPWGARCFAELEGLGSDVDVELDAKHPGQAGKRGQ